MRQASKAAVFNVLSGIAFGLFGLHAANAQTAPVTVSDFDVAGVKLGMTVDQAVAALQAFDSHYTIAKNYWQNDYTAYGQTGTPLNELGQGDLKPSFAFLTDIVAGKDCSFSSGGGTNPCGSYKPYDYVHIFFSPVIGQERVITIQRTTSFYQALAATGNEDTSQEPATSAVTAALTKKYSVPSYAQPATNFPEMDWAFDAKSRLISPARAQQLGLDSHYSGGYPGSVSSTDGVTMSVQLTLSSTGPTLVQDITTTLFDGAALYNSVTQGHNTYESQDAKMNAQDAARAAKSGNSPNL